MTKQILKPDFTTERKQMFNVITKIDNAYLQAWADKGAYVMLSDKHFWIMTNHVQLLFEIKEDSMLLECISTHSDDRKQGHGSEMMEIAVELADETNTVLSLQVANVTGNGLMMGQHPVIGAGMVKKNKILTSALPKWYEKFGFVKSPSYTAKTKDMHYTPKL